MKSPKPTSEPASKPRSKAALKPTSKLPPAAAQARGGLHLVPLAAVPVPASEAARKRPPKKPKAPITPCMLHCPRCHGCELIAARIGMELVAGRVRGGTLVYLCTVCLFQGQRVVVA